MEGHPERYYSEYEMARPIIRSFEEPEEEVVYTGHGGWMSPYWDPLGAPFIVHDHPAQYPYIGPAPVMAPYYGQYQ